MKVLITGLDGFVGQYLEKELHKRKDQIFCFDLKCNKDIRDYEQLRNALDKIRPDEIYHLAALAYVPESIYNPQKAFLVNTIGSINLLEAVKQLGLETRILLVGTSEEYGEAHYNKKVTEETLPLPSSPYAISKLAMDYLGRWYQKAYGLKVVVSRAFNHTGAGRGEMYAESSFAKQIVEIEKGKREYLEHGNLESQRNYTDVQDIVRAYTLAIKLPTDVYNICSDQNLKMKEILDILIKKAKCKIKTKINSARLRPSDFSFYPPSCQKFQKLTNWKPQIKIEQTLEDILNYWREKV